MAQENLKFFVKNVPLTDSITGVVYKRPYLRNIGHLICIELLAYVSKCQSKMVLHVTSVRQLVKTAMLPVEITKTVRTDLTYQCKVYINGLSCVNVKKITRVRGASLLGAVQQFQHVCL